jgi:hypothetical protein
MPLYSKTSEKKKVKRVVVGTTGWARVHPQKDWKKRSSKKKSEKKREIGAKAV